MNEEKRLIRTTEDKAFMYKALSGAGAIQMKNVIGEVIDIKHIIQGESTRENGDLAVLTSLITPDGTVYQSLSPTIDDCVRTLDGIFDFPNEIVKVVITNPESKNKRNFLQLELA